MAKCREEGQLTHKCDETIFFKEGTDDIGADKKGDADKIEIVQYVQPAYWYHPKVAIGIVVLCIMVSSYINFVRSSI